MSFSSTIDLILVQNEFMWSDIKVIELISYWLLSKTLEIIAVLFNNLITNNLLTFFENHIESS